MLIDIVSDLHLNDVNSLSKDFYTANAPVLAIVGDVCEERELMSMLPVFKRMSETWDRVLYVLGNHEYYNGFMDSTPEYFRNTLSRFDNIHVLDNDAVSIDGVSFVGTTLWSDMDKNNPITKQRCQRGINDYYVIHPSMKNLSFRSKAITPDDTVTLFNKSVAFIDEMLWLFTQAKKMVVLTHHAPSYQSIAPNFRTSPFNGAFASDLERIMIDNPKIKLWVHGHCHTDMEYMVDQCRVVCHPKGYYGENYSHSHDYIPLTVEI